MLESWAQTEELAGCNMYATNRRAVCSRQGRVSLWALLIQTKDAAALCGDRINRKEFYISSGLASGGGMTATWQAYGLKLRSKLW